MIVATTLQLLLTGGSGTARFVVSNLINILLGAGGMAALLYLGNEAQKKFENLDTLVRPLTEKNFAALTSLQADESNEQLGKSIKEIGIFIELFRKHTQGSAEIEKTLAEITKNMQVDAPQNPSDMPFEHFKEIESQAVQANSTLAQVESYFSSINEMREGQKQAIQELQARLALTAELEYSLVAALQENGKNAGGICGRISESEEQARSASNSIKNVSNNLEEITGIIKAINQTSQQTNMLSMNAAIESAHAGAAGAGFAVVAEEIRKLAEATRENAKNIQTMIQEISRQIVEASKASEISALAFDNLNTDMTALAGRLESVALDAHNQTANRAEIKTVLEDSSGESKKIRDSAVDIASFMASFKAALGNIQSLCDSEKIAAGMQRPQSQRSDRKLEVLLGQVLEYIKESEELYKIISPPASAKSAVPESSGTLIPSVKPVVPESSVMATPTIENLPIQNVPAESNETKKVEICFRRDVAVKTPPRDVY
ncbi:MAG: methyl-accepting chemotaxis protein [Treponema sp.]|nr:methyl-accepting chemotaxis protein [Treponema sp.]